LSECGYCGDELRNILNKAAETRPTPGGTANLRHHKSIVVRTVARAIKDRPGMRRWLPESTHGICIASCGATVLCLGFAASMGCRPPTEIAPLQALLLFSGAVFNGQH
jgi:hypothetical protein